MTDQSTAYRLSGDEIKALKFAAHRQLARWAQIEKLSRHQHAQRAALVRAAGILQDKAFTHGCELRGSHLDRIASHGKRGPAT